MKFKLKLKILKITNPKIQNIIGGYVTSQKVSDFGMRLKSSYFGAKSFKEIITNNYSICCKYCIILNIFNKTNDLRPTSFVSHFSTYQIFHKEGDNIIILFDKDSDFYQMLKMLRSGKYKFNKLPFKFITFSFEKKKINNKNK